jgi:hypothetical protein
MNYLADITRGLKFCSDELVINCATATTLRDCGWLAWPPFPESLNTGWPSVRLIEK